MTACELRALLDRFHKALGQIEDWAEEHRQPPEPHPAASVELHRVWCALDRECKLMRGFERQQITSKLAPPPPCPLSESQTP